ncbi:MAG: hypothetical protein NTY15_06140 [Planctomycetota bacterium]|nr:hypothetical protein [Planctomycetota bacterium]
MKQFQVNDAAMIPAEVTIAKSDRSDIFFIVISRVITADNSIAATAKTTFEALAYSQRWVDCTWNGCKLTK